MYEYTMCHDYTVQLLTISAFMYIRLYIMISNDTGYLSMPCPRNFTQAMLRSPQPALSALGARAGGAGAAGHGGHHPPEQGLRAAAVHAAAAGGGRAAAGHPRDGAAGATGEY